MTAKRGPVDVMRRVLSAPLLALLWLYQKLARPLMPPLCRFYPSCSDYAIEAVKLHGPFRGSLLAASRVSRCHPFHEGGVDPVPGSELEKQRALAQAADAQRV